MKLPTDFNVEMLNDDATKKDLTQGAQYLLALSEAHSAGQRDAAQDTINAYNPPRSYNLPEWMRPMWNDVTHCYNCGWDTTRAARNAALAKE